MPKYTMPDGNAYDFRDDAEATEAMNAWEKQFGTNDPSIMERLGSGVSATARTGLGILGAIPQGLRSLGELPATGWNVGEALDRSQSSNFQNILENVVPANELTRRGMEVHAHGMDKLQEAGGKIVRLPFEMTGMAGISDSDRKKLGLNGGSAEALETTASEALGNFLPLGGASKAKPKAKSIPDKTKFANLDAEMAKGGMNDPNIEIYKEHARKLQEEAQNRSAGALPDKITPIREAEMRAELDRRLSEEGLLPTERTGLERNLPLPEIFDPAIPPEGLKPGRLNDPHVRDPILEMDPRENMSPDLPQGPPPRSIVGVTAERGATGFEPNRPAPTPFAGLVEAARREREAGAGTVDFPGRVEHLTSDPMVQQMLRELEQRKSELPRMEAEKAKGGARAKEIAEAQRQTEARIAELEARLRDNGWTGELMSGEGKFYSGKGDTLAPIEKSGTRDTRLSPNVGKPFDPKRNGIGKFRKQAGSFDPSVFAEGFQKVYDSAKKGIRYIATGVGNALKIEAFDRNGDRIGGALFQPKDPFAKASETDLASKLTGVDSEFRRKGVAAEMYRFAASIGGDVSPSTARTKEGRAMWSGFEKSGLAEKGRIRSGALSKQAGAVIGVSKDSPVAKALGKMFSKKPEASTFEKTAGVEAAAQKIPGVGEAYDGISRQGTDPVAVIERNKDFSKDLTEGELRTGLTTSSGANLKAKSTKNPFLRSAYEMFDAAIKSSFKKRGEFVEPVMKLFREMSKQERTDLAELMIRYEGKRTFSADELARAGFSPREISMYEKLRAGMDETLKAMNEARALRGLSPMTARDGYAASTFKGAFKTIVRDKATKEPVYVISDNTKSGHDSLLAAYKEKFGKDFEFEVQDPRSYRKFRSQQGAADFFFQQFMSQLAKEDPRAAAMDSLYNEWKQTRAEFTFGENQHMKFKRDEAVGGAQGYRFELSPEENARYFLEAQIQHMENAFMWAENLKAYDSAGKLASGINERLPRTAEYIRNYRDNAIGARRNTLGRISDAMFEGNPYLASRASAWIKASLTSFLLGGPFNIGFHAIQILQVINSLPEMISVSRTKGVSRLELVKEIPEAITKTYTVFNKDAANAVRWAHDEGIIRSGQWIDVENLLNHPAAHAADIFWNGAPKLFDNVGRLLSFMQFYHLFKKHGSWDDAVRLAADATERSMTDYRGFESPMAAQSGGLLGQNAMFLHKYPANYINQLAGFAKGKEYLPLAALLGAAFFTGGVTGFIGIQAVEKAIEAYNALVTNVLKAPDYRMKSVKAMLFSAKAPDWVIYGPLSAMTGVDFSAKASFADLTPDNMGDAIMPGIGFAGNIAKQAMEGSMEGVIHAALPASLKGVSENMFYSTPNKDGTVNFNSPTTNELRAVRGPEDRMWRNVGLRSLSETRQNQIDYLNKERKQSEIKMELRAVNRWGKEVIEAEGNTFKIRQATEELVDFWRKAGLNEEQIASKLSHEIHNIKLPYSTREKLKAENNPRGYLKYQELNAR